MVTDSVFSKEAVEQYTDKETKSSRAPMYMALKDRINFLLMKKVLLVKDLDQQY